MHEVLPSCGRRRVLSRYSFPFSCRQLLRAMSLYHSSLSVFAPPSTYICCRVIVWMHGPISYLACRSSVCLPIYWLPPPPSLDPWPILPPPTSFCPLLFFLFVIVILERPIGPCYGLVSLTSHRLVVYINPGILPDGISPPCWQE